MSKPIIKKQCPICKSQFYGRSDKIFCTVKCKSIYHGKLLKATKLATAPIDKILHRNRSILLEIMGKKKVQIQVDKLELDKKKFNYTYSTNHHTNKEGKTVYCIYDFSWMVFSNQKILIRRIHIKAKQNPSTK